MISGLIAYTLVAGTLVALAALASEAACRYAALPRRWAWLGGMLMVVVLAAVSPLAPVVALFPGSNTTIDLVHPAAANVNGADAAEGEVKVLKGGASNFLADNRAAEAIQRQLLVVVGAITSTINDVIGERASWAPAVVWGATSTLLLLLLAGVHLRYKRARRCWLPVSLHGVHALVTPNAGPAVVGAATPDIIVPEWLLQRNSAEQKLVLAHEQEHVEQRDPLLLASAWVLVVLVPWHPAMWWMLNRMRLAVEIDCDARMLARGTARRAYGALLIDMSQQSHGLPLGATALADRTTHLERRLIAMNSKTKSYPRLRTAGFAVTALAVMLAACETRIPTSAEVDAVDASVIEGMAHKLWSPPDSSIVYYVDGVIVDEKAGRSVPSKSIATVEVKRANETRSFSQIHITTVNSAQVLVADKITVEAPGDTAKIPVKMVVSGDSLVIVGSRSTYVLDATNPDTTYLSAVTKADSAARARRNTYVVPPGVGADTAILTVRGGTLPGSDPVIQIRNPLSARGATQPMIIIDGVIQMDGLDTARSLDLNGDSIESIEVIRGEAAIRLYGTRAANGVINIRTKK